MYAYFGLDFFTSKKMVNGEHSGCWGLTVFSIEVIAREVNAYECEHWKALKHIIMNTGKPFKYFTHPHSFEDLSMWETLMNTKTMCTNTILGGIL